MVSRKAFEEWYHKTYPNDICGKWHEDEQRYTIMSTIGYAWETWKASRLSALDFAAEALRGGHVRTSVDCLNEINRMIEKEF